jgi:hypothetical protein
MVRAHGVGFAKALSDPLRYCPVTGVVSPFEYPVLDKYW